MSEYGLEYYEFDRKQLNPQMDVNSKSHRYLKLVSWHSAIVMRQNFMTEPFSFQSVEIASNYRILGLER